MAARKGEDQKITQIRGQVNVGGSRPDEHDVLIVNRVAVWCLSRHNQEWAFGFQYHFTFGQTAVTLCRGKSREGDSKIEIWIMPIQPDVGRDWMIELICIQFEFVRHNHFMDMVNTGRKGRQVDFHGKRTEVVKITILWKNIKQLLDIRNVHRQIRIPLIYRYL